MGKKPKRVKKMGKKTKNKSEAHLHKGCDLLIPLSIEQRVFQLPQRKDPDLYKMAEDLFCRAWLKLDILQMLMIKTKKSNVKER